MHNILPYTVLDSPVGGLLLVKHPASGAQLATTPLIRVAYLDRTVDQNDDLAALGNYFRQQPVPDEQLFGLETAQFEEYFAGKRQQFDLVFDLLLTKGFQKEALTSVREVPYGETASYGEIAIRAGRPNAYRAVGTACGHNPLALIVPCHRIIKADGTIGDYGSAGRDRKEFLLNLEARVAARH